jgi:hypothetical protein
MTLAALADFSALRSAFAETAVDADAVLFVATGSGVVAFTVAVFAAGFGVV